MKNLLGPETVMEMGGGEHCGCFGFSVGRAAEVYNMWPPWLRLISQRAVNGGAGQEVLLQREKEEDDAAASLCCDKEITSLTVGQRGVTLQSTSLQR